MKDAIESREIEDEDSIRERINERIYNECIYYKTCFEIAMELNATDFSEFPNFGEIKSISQLAYAALDEYVSEELNINELTDLIETIATSEERK